MNPFSLFILIFYNFFKTFDAKDQWQCQLPRTTKAPESTEQWMQQKEGKKQTTGEYEWQYNHTTLKIYIFYTTKMIFVPFKGKIRVEINFFIKHSIPQSKNTHEDLFMKAVFFQQVLKVDIRL